MTPQSTLKTGLTPLLLIASLFLVAWAAPPTETESVLSRAGENLEGRETPAAAALDMFHACTRRSPTLFIQTRLLGVCDGPISTLNKYAEALHTTKYINGEHALTVYDLPKLMKEETARVVGSRSFTEEHLESLWLQAASTYYTKQLKCFVVAAENNDGLEYQTRIVVATHSDEPSRKWYALPRCRSSRSFYEIADAMDFKSDTPKQ